MKLNQLPETVTVPLTAKRLQHAEEDGIVAVLYQVQFPHAPEAEGPMCELTFTAEEFEQAGPEEVEARLHAQFADGFSVRYFEATVEQGDLPGQPDPNTPEAHGFDVHRTYSLQEATQPALGNTELAEAHVAHVAQSVQQASRAAELEAGPVTAAPSGGKPAKTGFGAMHEAITHDIDRQVLGTDWVPPVEKPLVGVKRTPEGEDAALENNKPPESGGEEEHDDASQ